MKMWTRPRTGRRFREWLANVGTKTIESNVLKTKQIIPLIFEERRLLSAFCV